MDSFQMGLDPKAPFMFERMLRLWLLGEQEEDEFTSEAEFKVGLQEYEDQDLSRRYLASIKDKPLEMAQELAYQAYEADSPESAETLAAEALALDPNCVDALTLHASLTAEDVDQLIPQLEHAASCGEKALGEDFFAEFMGDFWPMVEARPYMRCIKQLAIVLWNVGRRFDAVAQYENLMDLDPDDHGGQGGLLLGNYLAMGEVQRSWDLLEEIDDELSAVFNWSWVLLCLMVEDEEGAKQALDHALDGNPYVAPLLIGLGDEEELLVEPTFIIGSREEALYCVQVLGEAWTSHLSAHWWLLDVLREMGLVTESDAPRTEGPQTIN